jgi:hypothetical protein
MSREVTIPKCRNPFVVIINGIKYTYQSGETVELPDEVAEVIEFHVNSKPRPDPNAGKSDSIVFVPFEITENGTYTSPEGEAYSPIIVNVKESGGDETFPADKYFEGGHAEVVLPNATKIKQYAFYQDKTLISVDMPNVTEIGKEAFNYCDNLTTVDLSKVKSVGEKCFYSCQKLEITSLESLETVGKYGFNACLKLTSGDFPNLKSAADSAFASCRGLKKLTLPAGVSLGAYTFDYCGALKTVTFQGKPSSIATNIFSGCFVLETINVPWAEGAVSGAPWGASSATINYNYTGE